MISTQKAKDQGKSISVILFIAGFCLVFFLSAITVHAYYSFLQSPWAQTGYTYPMFPGNMPYSYGYRPYMQPSSFFPASNPMSSFFGSGIPGFSGAYPYNTFSYPYNTYSYPYNTLQQPQFSPLAQVFPSSPYASLGTMGFNMGAMNPYMRPDPQWRASQELTPVSTPILTPTAGIDTGEFRIMPPANANVGVTYTPLIPGYVNRQLIVMFRPGVPAEERAFVLSRHNCMEIRTSMHAGFTLVALPISQSVRDTAEQFIMEPAVLYAEPNYYRHAHLVPNDPYYRYQWHLPHMYTDWAWNLASGLGVTVGLLDSGVSYRNSTPYALAPDLAGTSMLAGWDFVNADAYPDDDAGHGTHMCGCIAQTTNNLVGVAGVAYRSTVLIVKVMDSLGNVTIADESDGIYYAANNGAKVISLSLGGPGISVTEQTAVQYAYNLGATLFASSGNAGSSVPEYPAAYVECISVGSVQYDRTRPSYSNYGAELDLVAPGGNITLDQNLDGYADGILQQTHDGTNLSTFFYYFMEGTSPACALASGVGALVIDKSTTALTPASVRSILQNNAIDLGTAGWDQYYGWGEIDAYSAVLSTP